MLKFCCRLSLRSTSVVVDRPKPRLRRVDRVKRKVQIHPTDLEVCLQRARSADQSRWLPCWSYFFPPVFPYSAILAITCNLYTADRTNSRSYQNKSSNKSMFPSFFMKMLHFYGRVSLYQNVANLAA